MSALVATELGQGPDLVLLHGVGVGPHTFLPLAEDLAVDHRVLLVHRPGGGGGAVALEEQAAAVADTVAALATGPVEVVGVSGGATLALVVALCHPDVVAGLVVHEPLVGPLAPELHERFQLAAARASLGADEALEVVRGVIGSGTWDRLSAGARAEVVAGAAWARAEIPLFAAFAPGADELRRLARHDLLVTVGADSGPERHTAAAVLADLGGGVVRIIPGSGNAVQLDAPRPFAEAIRARARPPVHRPPELTVHVDATDPYPWPYDGRIEGPSLALVLPGWDEAWAARVLDPGLAIDACERLADAVHAAGGMVVGVAHRGQPALALPCEGLSIGADGLDAFYGGPIDGVLRRAGRTHLLVAGLGLEGPVHSTLRSANDRGYECLLVVDACAPLTDTLVDASAKTVTMSGGIFGAIGTLAAALTAVHLLPSPLVPLARQGEPT